MKKLILAASMSATLLLAACGGGGGSTADAGSTPQVPPSDTFVTRLLAFVGMSSDTTEPQSVESFAVTTSDTTEPSPL